MTNVVKHGATNLQGAPASLLAKCGEIPSDCYLVPGLPKAPGHNAFAPITFELSFGAADPGAGVPFWPCNEAQCQVSRQQLVAYHRELATAAGGRLPYGS